VVRYAESVLAPLEDSRAKAYLQAQGLPDEHLLFAAYAPAEVSVKESGGGRRWLCVGSLGDGRHLGVDLQTGEAADIDEDAGETWHVNADVEKFAATLVAFERMFPFYPADNDMERKERAAEALRALILEIDPTAFDEDPGYWNTVVFDVANGDYADE
jgi:hypothetical protein